MRSVLVVDDKELMRDSVCSTLKRANFEVLCASDGQAALETIARKRPDAVVTDLKMPGITGIELLEKIRQIDDDLPVVLMTAFGTIETAVSAIKLGAFDYLTKPFEGDELIIAVKRAIEHRRLVRENALLKAGSNGSGASEDGAARGAPIGLRGMDRLIGSSDAMKRLRDEVAAIAGSHGTVLVHGESGAGKEVVARTIHDCSPRKENPFLAVNCAALSESLLESELFGHEKGAFTGADKLRKGRFELADGGTLLLDEVSEVSPSIQAKLLRVLQERAFERVGSSLTIGVDVRLIATSNRDLPASVTKGEFRQDLYFRLNVLPIRVPSLRERRTDVAELANHFVGEICRREGRTAMRFTSDATDLMMGYAWPGNVRELQNICERAVVLGNRSREEIGRELIEPWLLGQPAAAASSLGTMQTAMMNGAMGASIPVSTMVEGKPGIGGFDLDRPLEDIEREAIVRTLQKFNGHRQKTAHALGIGVRTLGLKLKKWKQLQLVEETL
ncbi:MAG: sigma-54 dependent transcriptional regulator [Planctomycetota bacterium]|nr:sigma-54 dependent transcriptional regulator [Planctomycetota bacterium]